MHGLVSSILVGVFFGLLSTCSPAHAEEPCHHDGDTVVCTEAGFGKLVDATLDFKGRAQTAEVQLAAREKDIDDAKRALDACIASTSASTPPSPHRAMLAYAAGIIGTALAAASPNVSSPTAQSVLLWTGLVFIGGGAAFVLP